MSSPQQPKQPPEDQRGKSGQGQQDLGQSGAPVSAGAVPKVLQKVPKNPPREGPDPVPPPVAAAPAVPQAPVAAPPAAAAPAIPQAAAPDAVTPQSAPVEIASDGTTANPGNAPATPKKNTGKRRARKGKKQAIQIQEDTTVVSTAGRFKRVIVPYSVSIIVHALVLSLLGFWVLPSDVQEELLAIISTPIDEVEDDKEDEVVEAAEQPEEIEQSDLAPTDLEVSADQLVDVPSPITLDVNDLEPAIDVDLPDLAGPSVQLPKGDFGGRSLAGRKERAIAEGGSEASEAAVVRGLSWLAKIQSQDGGWNYTTAGAAKAGTLDNQMGATSMAVLAYLGAGHTNFGESKYVNTVGKGLGFLLRNAKQTADGLDMRGDVKRNEGMYVQGLGGIALTEAYGMALGAYMVNKSGKDKTGRRKLEFQSMKQLKNPAQAALNFIARAQHPTNGGWRYQPRSSTSDTSVVGWQIMALQSGRSSRLVVPVNVMRGASHFLDVVAADGGAQYGYDKPASNRSATTAVGLLCRMYMGWNQSNEALGRGVKFLSKLGPQRNNMYFNYYATQVMHHWGGDEWKKWNTVMRDQLVDSQVTKGPMAGSWKPAGGHASTGGALMQTCFAIMTLEVYYRHLPLYKKATTKAEQF